MTTFASWICGPTNGAGKAATPLTQLEIIAGDTQPAPWVAEEAAAAIAELDGFHLVTDCHLALFTFQYAPDGENANVATEGLLRAVNDDGRIYLTQTTHEGQFVIRFQVGQFDGRREDALLAVDVLRELTTPGSPTDNQ